MIDSLCLHPAHSGMIRPWAMQGWQQQTTSGMTLPRITSWHTVRSPEECFGRGLSRWLDLHSNDTQCRYAMSYYQVQFAIIGNWHHIQPLDVIYLMCSPLQHADSVLPIAYQLNDCVFYILLDWVKLMAHPPSGLCGLELLVPRTSLGYIGIYNDVQVQVLP